MSLTEEIGENPSNIGLGWEVRWDECCQAALSRSFI